MGSDHTEDEEKSEFYAWVLITQNPKKNQNSGFHTRGSHHNLFMSGTFLISVTMILLELV
jgi:hypothetical protein